jgi:predicted permease
VNWFAELARRLSMLFRRRRFDADLEEEMRLHLELRQQEKIQAGLAPDEARSAAMRRFGNPTALREASHTAWGWQWFERFLQDISYGLRGMLRSPSVTAIAILSLALGIGANTAIFSLLDAVMLRVLPVQEPDRLVLFGHGLWVGSQDTLPDRSWDLFSYPFYREISQKKDVFSGVTAIDSIEFSSHGSVANGSPEVINADLVSGSFFSVLGVQPFLGRTLTEADDRAPGAGPVAVASYSWWKQRFGSDPSVLGRTVNIEKHNYTIVGVAAPNFFGASVGQAPDLWIPLSMEKEISPGWNGLDQKFFQSLYLIGRLKPGVTAAQASANTNLLFKQILRSEYVGPQPSQKESQSIDHALIELTPAAHGLSQIRSHFSLPLEILMTVVGLVLLIACANIANLLLARGMARSREIAVRMAIGATRLRLIVQLLTESFVLALLGAAVGIALAWPAGHLLLRMAAGGFPVALDVSPDLRVLGFTLLLTVFTALLFGMAPAVGATRLQLTSSLKEGRDGSSSPARNRLAPILVVSQIALSVVLLAGAGLFLRSLRKLTSVDTGFDRQNVLVFQLDESSLGYQQDDPRLRNLLQQIEQRVSELPGIRSVSFSFFTFNQGEWSNDVTLQGIPRTPENSHETLNNVVGHQFFATLGLPVLAGAPSPLRTRRSPRKSPSSTKPWRASFSQACRPSAAASAWVTTRRTAVITKSSVWLRTPNTWPCRSGHTRLSTFPGRSICSFCQILRYVTPGTNSRSFRRFARPSLRSIPTCRSETYRRCLTKWTSPSAANVLLRSFPPSLDCSPFFSSALGSTASCPTPLRAGRMKLAFAWRLERAVTASCGSSCGK